MLPLPAAKPAPPPTPEPEQAEEAAPEPSIAGLPPGFNLAALLGQ